MYFGNINIIYRTLPIEGFRRLPKQGLEPMPHFHFHVHNVSSSPDQGGSDVVDFDEASRQALHMAGVMLQEQGQGHSPVSPLCVEVADESEDVVLSVQVGLLYRNNPDRQFGDRLSSHLT